MRVLVTRPKEDSAALTSRLLELGCEVTCAPLIEIVLEPIAAADLEEAGALIATSRNGLRALAQSDSLERARALTMYAVGSATAAFASELGFREVIEGPGTAADLVSVIRSSNTDRQKPFVHLAGDRLAFDLTSALADAGIELRKVGAYRSVAAETLPDDVWSQILHGDIAAVILMSPRTAAIWIKLVNSRGVPSSTLGAITHLCLSPAVATALSTVGDQSPPITLKTLVANRPDTEELLALIKRLAAD